MRKKIFICIFNRQETQPVLYVYLAATIAVTKYEKERQMKKREVISFIILMAIIAAVILKKVMS